MDRPTTPHRGAPPHYGGPPAYSAADDEDESPAHQHQAGASMRLLTNAEDTGYIPSVSPLPSYRKPYVSDLTSSTTSLLSGIDSTMADVGHRKRQPEVGKQAAAEAAIVDMLRDAGPALSQPSNA
ncbi:hypothetical protein K469DRAFT_482538, partial [Zopfia rhizophila CBS 207.26]